MAIKNIFDILTRVKYVGQDFDTYVNELQDFLQTNYPDDYKDYVQNNLGVGLLQVIAYANQNLAFYINQRTTNLYLTKSTSPVAISYIARMLNYFIQPAEPARTEVSIQLPNGPYAFPVVMKKGFKFNAEKGLTYEYRQDVDIVFAPGETQKTFEIREGTTTKNIFTSSGDANQKFLLAGVENGSFVAGKSFTVLVGTEEWTEQNIITFDALPIFEVNYLASPVQIRFGDGVAGLVPTENQTIEVDYVVCKGLQGNIAQNGILSAQDQLVSNNTVIPITIISSTESSGGDDPEDLRKVKTQAPEFFQSQDRAITKRDYDAIVNNFAGVAKSDATIIRSIEQDAILNDYLDALVDSVSGVSGSAHYDVINVTQNLRTYLSSIISDTCRSNTVQVSVLSKNINNRYVSPTTQLREDIRLYLEDRNDAVHVVTVIDGSPKIVEVDIEVEILVGLNSVESEVINNAEQSLIKDNEQPYGLLILRDYGKSLYLSDLYKAVRESQVQDGDIEYVNIKILGPNDKIDAQGNLIIDKLTQEIIQPGTINVKPIARV